MDGERGILNAVSKQFFKFFFFGILKNIKWLKYLNITTFLSNIFGNEAEKEKE